MMPTEDYDHVDLSRPYRCAVCGMGLRYRPEDGWCDACATPRRPEEAALLAYHQAMQSYVAALTSQDAAGAAQRDRDEVRAVPAPPVRVAGCVDATGYTAPLSGGDIAREASVLGRNIGFEKAEVEPWRR